MHLNTQTEAGFRGVEMDKDLAEGHVFDFLTAAGFLYGAQLFVLLCYWLFLDSDMS